MYEGTVDFYNPVRRFGFIKPDTGGNKIFFHYSKGSLGLSARNVPVPEPKMNDRIRYIPTEGPRPRAIRWVFSDIKERLNTLTSGQQQQVRLVLGEEEAEKWEIWDASDELAPDRRYDGREWFGAHRYDSGGPRGTFNQVLLWARYYLADCGIPGPPLQRWADMPRYKVQYKADGQWHLINIPRYTRVQAEALEQHLLAEGRYAGVRVVDLWPTAPPLTIDEAVKVLAECSREVIGADYLGDLEVSWIDHSWGRDTVVAHAVYSQGHSWLTLDGQTYFSDEANQH
jgi:hypothetical protein